MLPWLEEKGDGFIVLESELKMVECDGKESESRIILAEERIPIDFQSSWELEQKNLNPNP